jgi:dTDP-4-dehydrorhamnose reductase
VSTVQTFLHIHKRKKLKILVIGSTGLLGSKLTPKLDKLYEIYPTYNTNQLEHNNSIKVNILVHRQIEKNIIELKPDVIIHLAAMTHVDNCEKNPELTYQVNTQSTINILKNAEKTSSQLVFLSTDYVFNGEKGNYSERDQPDPINIYGKTKYEAEKAILHSEIESTIIRTSVMYGNTPGSGKTNFVIWVINQLMEKKPISIITDQTVSPTYNQNLANMITEIVERKLTGIYNLSGDTQINRFDFSKKIAEQFELDKNLITPTISEKMLWIAKRPKNSTLLNNKASNTLYNKPEKLEDSLKKLKMEFFNKIIVL